MKFKHLFISLILIITGTASFGQVKDSIPDFDFSNPKKYYIGGITVSGIQFVDPATLISYTGLAVGQSIELPGESIRKVMDKLWSQGLFGNIKISVTSIADDKVFLDLNLTERPRLSSFVFKGIRKTEADELKDKMKLIKGEVVTDNMLVRTKNLIQRHYISKGFFDCSVDIRQAKDTSNAQGVNLVINIQKNARVRIDKINIVGNKQVSDFALKASLKKTKERSIYHPLYAIQQAVAGLFDAKLRNRPITKYPAYVKEVFAEHMKMNIFKSSKFIEKDFDEDKVNLIKKFNENGYRDAVLLRDSVYKSADGLVTVDFVVDEGRKFYYRKISFVGNTKYTNEQLGMVLGINKGDVFNQEELDKRLSFDQTGQDLTSVYMDDGYLAFHAMPVEVSAENDSIDLEIRIHEGKQFTVNKVTVSGNDRTNDHVILREARTMPAQLFSRNDIITTQNTLRQLKYFDPEKIMPTTDNQNMELGTVDIGYKVEETSSDQLELSGGYGYGRLIGTLGVSFNNFSTRNIRDKKAWRPIPTGDGQKLSLRMQSYGIGYFSFSGSFTEPWLGGSKPNALSISLFHSVFSNGLAKTDPTYYSYQISGLSFVLTKRLSWPDPFFSLSQSINFQQYRLKNYAQYLSPGLSNGLYHNYSYQIALSRSSLDAAIFPRSGSDVNFSIELTPPYSRIAPSYFSSLNSEGKNRMVEYHQWKFSASFYKQIIGDLVIFARTKYGFLGKYSNDFSVTPFNRYFMGGDGMSGYSSIDGRQLVGMRGYQNETMTPNYVVNKQTGGTIFNKNTLELRYPLSTNPNSTIFGLVFLEAGNDWLKFKDFNPFGLKRSAGVGVRVFLPMFGLLGLDWGYGFDAIPGIPGANKGQFHFSLNGSID
jgi:outer membrane protein insertion porin family